MSMEKLRLATDRYALHPSLSMGQSVQNGLPAICAMSFTMMRESQTSGATSNHYFLANCVHLLEVFVLSVVHLTSGTQPAEHPARHRIRFSPLHLQRPGLPLLTLAIQVCRWRTRF